MCLALIADTARPSAQEIVDADLANQDGIGVAYQEPHNHLITWKKGLAVAEAQELAESLPLPFILHFRMATHGGMSRLLCHPFPISRNVGVTMHGQARELLFHNGIWNQHAKFEKRAALRGPVSDTRIMAYVLWREGQENRSGVASQLAAQAGKLAVFTPEGITTYGEWTEGTAENKDTTEGCLYSNLNHCSLWTVPTHYFHDHSARGWDHYLQPRRSAQSTRLLADYTFDAWNDEELLGQANLLPRVEVLPEAASVAEEHCSSCDLTIETLDTCATIDGHLVCDDCLDLWTQATRPTANEPLN
jgi:predicted glutamine amidotransferase